MTSLCSGNTDGDDTALLINQKPFSLSSASSSLSPSFLQAPPPHEQKPSPQQNMLGSESASINNYRKEIINEEGLYFIYLFFL
jgi:hypothetical protein